MTARWKATIAAALAALLGIVGGLIATRADDRPAIQLPDELFGVDGHVLRTLSAEGNLEVVDAHLDQVSELGITFVRSNLDWLELQPAPPSGDAEYDFSSHDAWVKALAIHGLRWYVIGYGTPEWAADPKDRAAGCSIFSPPARPEEYSRMMAAIAERYGSEGSFWSENPRLPFKPVVDYEIWNEPNLGTSWCPTPEPAEFAELAGVASAAIRDRDPDARIVMGGLAPFFEDRAATPSSRAAMAADKFLTAATQARDGLPDEIDIVGIHAYGDPPVIAQQVEDFRAATDSSTLEGAPLSLNETGWTTQGTGAFAPVDEPTRAGYIRSVITDVATSPACNVTSIAPHTWVTEETDPANQEHWFGIADPADGKPYPTATEYGDVIGELENGEASQIEQDAALCSP